MALPIGFFAPLPIPLMIPFMMIQSLAIGAGFGVGYQGSRRKISAMSNDEFNAMTPTDFAKLTLQYTEIAPEVFRQGMEHVREINAMMISEMLRLLNDAIRGGIDALSGGTLGTDISNALTGGTASPPVIPPGAQVTDTEFLHDIGIGASGSSGSVVKTGVVDIERGVSGAKGAFKTPDVVFSKVPGIQMIQRNYLTRYGHNYYNRNVQALMKQEIMAFQLVERKKKSIEVETRVRKTSFRGDEVHWFTQYRNAVNLMRAPGATSVQSIKVLKRNPARNWIQKNSTWQRYGIWLKDNP